ncbi:MAG: ATP cone domain-containing protein [Planctomycetota bacterium]
MRIQTIRKRDGRCVPYDRAKIVSAVARAEAAAGAPRAGFAEEVAGLVELLLERRFGDPAIAQPGIEDIQDQVERALVEMGAASVAKAFILYRERRAQARAALVVRGDRGDESRSGFIPRPLRVEAKDGNPSWSKGRIVAALMSEADLSRASAEEVASRVETRVFASGMRSISTALVRELVDNELVDLGYENALRRHRPIGIPRHDLRRLLLDRTADRAGRTIGSAVAGEILGRYAVEDLLPPSVADLVRAGEIDFEDLSEPQLPLSLSITVEALSSGASAAGKPDAGSAAALLPEIGGLVRSVSRTVAIEGLDPFLVALERSSGASLRGFVAALGGIAAASGREVEIVLAGPRALPSILGALAGLEREHGPDALPRLGVEAGTLLHQDGAAGIDADHLLRRGLLRPCWSGDGERHAGPGLVRRSSERGPIACGAALILDLPRLARRAGAWREDRLFESAAERIEAGIQGLLALRDFQREARDPKAPRARIEFALAPAGLSEALTLLGDGEQREEQAGRLLGFLAEAAERLGRAQGITLVATPAFAERAAARFARIDALEFRVHQPWLFGEAAEVFQSRAYASGLEAVFEPVLCALVGALPTGSLGPASVLAEIATVRPEIRELPALSALGRIERRRGRTRGGPRALYPLPPTFEPSSDLFTLPTP